MKETNLNAVKELGDRTNDLIRIKITELKNLRKKDLSYNDRKKVGRLDVALHRAVDIIRRSMLDDEILI